MWRMGLNIPKAITALSFQDGCRTQTFGGSTIINSSLNTHQEISSDQHSARSGPKLPHNYIALLLIHVTVLQDPNKCSETIHTPFTVLHLYTLTSADTVKSRACIFSVNQSTFLLVFRKITACVIVKVSYRSHSVSSFHSFKSKSTLLYNQTFCAFT